MSASNTDRLAESVNKVSVGRVYDYLLGGVHNYAVDQAFAEEQLRLLPDIRDFAVSNRAFLGRAVKYAVSQGIRQFVDIGSGLPTQGNVHEVADEVAPGECRVVYIDNEPIARAHAEILLEKTADPARHRAIDADFFDGGLLWERVLATGVIDETQPIALLAVALLHFMPPETHPERMLAYYRDRLPEGSLVVVSHAHIDPSDTEALAVAKKLTESYTKKANSPAMPRPREEIAAFFEGLEMVEPGLVWLPEWRPEGQDPYSDDPARARGLAGVGRKI
ncbi:SAM-dependent methyltransferase [Saccharomonospora glauca]|jgi:O-methyltransferase involved in polyketide biosynthesis|uniref:O-methyltransferase involved in polyketide biosynthesis n=1 Tax=Saccharomonospora glauca K62 TaxID=928724 RepID=I1D284_9PSEU|nr:SAM-dependent methyltransferase [Saccharomonospora glauca]EIE99058.1 O-methyltransferase involved in polyketide biosynthesis [Saccharomonospora glauca K62]